MTKKVIETLGWLFDKKVYQRCISMIHLLVFTYFFLIIRYPPKTQEIPLRMKYLSHLQHSLIFSRLLLHEGALSATHLPHSHQSSILSETIPINSIHKPRYVRIYKSIRDTDWAIISCDWRNHDSVSRNHADDLVLHPHVSCFMRSFSTFYKHRRERSQDT